ncbi:hypothetical protein [Thalassoroseus pseudoceratinae]|uniref:hypothetical protein n=1 Tax=Thalassoroseus pseudoceratinae TaxID=2713176 RepID=UPI0014216E53|nr:hypothetical protein [Thalassoroseus pseudoceratinae]
MSQDWDWVGQSTRRRPKIAWTFHADAPLRSLELVGETGMILLADRAGFLAKIDSGGNRLRMVQGFRKLTRLATGRTADSPTFVAFQEELRMLGADFQTAWVRRFNHPISALTVEPYGRWLAVALESGDGYLIGQNNERFSDFTSKPRPRHVVACGRKFEVTVATKYGRLERFNETGDLLWTSDRFGNLGDMKTDHLSPRIWLAAYNHGVVSLERSGEPGPTFLVNGSPSRVAVSYDSRFLAVGTQEQSLYWLNNRGELLWATHVAEEIQFLEVDPLGHWLLCGFESGKVVRIDWPR